ncbi:heavy metal translocating P-type ATPase [Anaerotignum sp.]|uniref:heavy metal translocating P-type ATPase n=1 Tax=Anaerotignum sp. TaxID=2039241 RepID=UPI003FA4BE42
MTISLKGLTCANCAGKIEKAVGEMPETKEAEINLLKQEMRLVPTAEADREKLLEKVTETVHKYEKDVEVSLAEQGQTCNIAHGHCDGDCCGHTHSHEEVAGKKLIFRFGVGVAFFVAACLWQKQGQTALFLISYAIFGYDVILQALKNIFKGQVFDENFLMSLSTVGAMVIGEMSEAVFVMLFYQVGEAFQDYAVRRSRRSITALMDIRPDFAHVLTSDGSLRKVSPEQVAIGDVIVVKAGEKIPLDGTVVEGSALLDTAALTGESLPREVETGSTVLSGCINQDGLLHVEVTKPFGESTVMKILELVENAAGRKSKTEKFITRFARVYTPAVVGLAVLLAVVPPILGQGAFSQWIGRALIFLVVSCPCALVLSVPLSYFAGVGAASKNGILIKGGNVLDTLCHTKRIVFDKTGTLTKGRFTVTKIEGENPAALLEMAAAGESLSNHPVACAIAKHYETETGRQPEGVTDYAEQGGMGITCQWKGAHLALGNRRLMEKEGVACPEAVGSGSVVYVAKDGIYQGYLLVDDTIKDGAAEALAALTPYGVTETVMLTGDGKAAAEKVGKTLGIHRIYAELLPADKLHILENLPEMEEGAKTAFVGDGINDAPVLAGADVGIAMGAMGSDAAMEAADVVLMDDDLRKISVGLRIAKNTRKIVMQNIVFALGVKILVLLLGALGMATMWMAVFADVGVAVLAILNAMRKK